MKEGNIINDGYNEEVDKLRRAKSDGKDWLAKLENDEREKTGIKNLKIKYNKVVRILFRGDKLLQRNGSGILYTETDIGKCRKIYYSRAERIRRHVYLERRTNFMHWNMNCTVK